jgi:hypothetical protein
MIFDLRLLLRSTIRAIKHAGIVPPGLASPIGLVGYAVEMLHQIEIFGILARGTINPDFAGGAGLEKFTRI